MESQEQLTTRAIEAWGQARTSIGQRKAEHQSKLRNAAVYEAKRVLTTDTEATDWKVRDFQGFAQCQIGPNLTLGFTFDADSYPLLFVVFPVVSMFEGLDSKRRTERRIPIRSLADLGRHLQALSDAQADLERKHG